VTLNTFPSWQGASVSCVLLSVLICTSVQLHPFKNLKMGHVTLTTTITGSLLVSHYKANTRSSRRVYRRL